MMTTHIESLKKSSGRATSGRPDVSKCVLVVDDDADYLRSIRRLIEADGWHVKAVDDPCAALAALAEDDFAVVLSDYEMGQMDGVQFLSAVRHSAPHSMRLLVTGNSDFNVAVNAVNEGSVYRFVPKVATGEALLEAIRSAGETFAKRRAERNDEAEDRAEQLRLLEAQFDSALSGLWMAYQPIVSSQSGNGIVAYEALMRTTSQELKTPPMILDAAERLNGIRELGRTVRKRVADELARTADIDVFVNLHALELMDENLYDPRSPLTRHANRVVLEITERVALSHVEGIRDRLQQLRSLGFRIAVDDLGAGYAGLGSLVELEPEIVKLDMGLVRNIHQSATKQKLVRAVVALGRELGWKLVGEGVEVAEERDVLTDTGCDLLQGYLFGKPARL
jgi:EAL domain-containing protein (putative c-di-GMP-specific phosphodiesterase class I)